LEHTHLVKGLDYALLDKVLSEIEKKPDAEGGKDLKSSYLPPLYSFSLFFLNIYSFSLMSKFSYFSLYDCSRVRF